MPRIGAVVVTWETFPKLRGMLASAGLRTGLGSGWLFSVTDVSSSAGLCVSVLFPWRDAAAFLAAVERLALGAGDPLVQPLCRVGAQHHPRRVGLPFRAPHRDADWPIGHPDHLRGMGSLQFDLGMFDTVAGQDDPPPC